MEKVLVIADLHGEFNPFLSDISLKNRFQEWKGILSVGDFVCRQCVVCLNPNGYHRRNCSHCSYFDDRWIHDGIGAIVERLGNPNTLFPLPLINVDGNAEYIVEQMWPTWRSELMGQYPTLKLLGGFEVTQVGSLKVLSLPFNIRRVLGIPKRATIGDIKHVIRPIVAEIRAKFGVPDVVLSHYPPNGVADVSRNLRTRMIEHLGSNTVRSFLEEMQPPIAICGHLHYYQRGRLGSSFVFTLTRPLTTTQISRKRTSRTLTNYLIIEVEKRGYNINIFVQGNTQETFFVPN